MFDSNVTGVPIACGWYQGMNDNGLKTKENAGNITEQQLEPEELQFAVRFSVWVGVIEMWFHQTE
jgi:hypothetical protein